MEKQSYKTDLMHRLFEIKAIMHGEFTLENGVISPVHIDLKRIISFPDVYQYVVDLMWQEMNEREIDHIGGVPYAALPLASGIALLYQKSMVMPRKEGKQKGISGTIDGAYAAGDTVVLVEDVVVSGNALLQTIDTLEQAGLAVKEVVAFMDRQQGATKRLAERGIHLRAVCTLSQAIDSLHASGTLDADAVDRIATFIKEHQF